MKESRRILHRKKKYSDNFVEKVETHILRLKTFMEEVLFMG